MPSDQPDAPALDAVRTALDQRAIPIDIGTVPGDGCSRLAAAVADADVIGLGEASHGTAEFATLRHAIIRALVHEHGLRVLALEANVGATLALDEYVTGGDGSLEAALAQPGIHENFRTDGVRALLEWVRAFNEGREPADRLRVRGLDIQSAVVPARRLRAHLQRSDADAPHRLQDALDQLAEDTAPRPTGEEHLTARATVEELFPVDDVSDGSSSSVTERLVWAIEQGRRQYRAVADGRLQHGTNIKIRDSAMAAQVQWLRRHTGHDRVAVWAHNAHLDRMEFSGGDRRGQGLPSLGRNLATMGAIDYAAVGLHLCGGAVSAVYTPEEEVRVVELDGPPEGSLPAVCDGVDGPAFAIDLGSIEAESPLATYFEQDPLAYDIAGSYVDTPASLVETDCRRQFDYLLVVKESTPAAPLGL
ncbi:MAG: erythromycin esterase family protein [Halobacteriaceae archaeon]